MNDTSVSAAVRSRLAEVHESLTDVHMGTGVGDILHRARRRRARHRHAALALAAGTGGSLALAGVLLVPGSTAPAGAHDAQLAAWTVSRQANGEIRVTIRELKDPAGLQRKLRADGVPASVSFMSDQNPACRSYPPDLARLRQVFPWPKSLLPHVVILIRPKELPRGAGVLIASSFPGWRRSNDHGPRLVRVTEIGLVYASPGCTGH
jgi:hypothetical protein